MTRDVVIYDAWFPEGHRYHTQVLVWARSKAEAEAIKAAIEALPEPEAYIAEPKPA